LTKICFILGSHWDFRKGGSEYQTKLLIDYLQKLKKYKIYYIFAGNKDEKLKAGDVIFYSVSRHQILSKFGNSFFLDTFKILRILKDIRPHILYQRTGCAYTGIAAYYSKKNRCRMIWHVSLLKDVEKIKIQMRNTLRPFYFIDKIFLRYGISNTDIIICQANYQNELLKKNYKRECDLIIPNFHPAPETSVRKSNNIKVVWISNIKRFKQPELFLKLADKLRNYKVKFIMIGRMDYKKFQKKITSYIKKIKNIEYLGEKSIKEVNRILCESHILVNTSEYEGFPNTFIQAWMRKVPVVSLNVDPDNILKKFKIGFHSNTFENMVEDVKRLIGDKELREEMGERAQKYALKYHSMENIKKIIDMIKEGEEEANV